MLVNLLLFAGVAALTPFRGPEEIGDPEFWIANDDYPPDAIRSHSEGTTVIEVSVNKWGRTARCRVVETSGAKLLDETACAAIGRRGRWKPTTDALGQPIFAVYRRRVNWRLPESRLAPDVSIYRDLEIEVAKLPLPADQAVVVVRQIQDASGGVESCDIAVPSPARALNAAACKLAESLAKRDLIADESGVLQRGARWRTIQFVESK